MLKSALGTILLSFIIQNLTLANSKDVQATCKAYPAEEGKSGSIEFSFEPPIDQLDETYLLYIRKGDSAGTNDVFRCDGMDKNSPVKCAVRRKDLDFQRQGNNVIFLIFPNASPDLQGSYTLGAVLDKSNFTPATCNFTLAVKTGNLTGKPEDTPSVASIVAPVVAIVIVAGIIVAIIFIIRRKRRSANDNTEETEAEERMNPS